MNYFRALFFATFVSLMIATIVSFFPFVEIPFSQQGEAEMMQKNSDLTALDDAEKEHPVFQRVNPLELKQKQVVPFVQEIPLHYSYKNVQIEDDQLFIVTKVEQEEQIDHHEIYQDALTLMEAVYRNTKNIDKLYFRVMLEHELQPQLILSVNSTRGDFERYAPSTERAWSEEELEEWMKNAVDVVYGTGWRK